MLTLIKISVVSTVRNEKKKNSSPLQFSLVGKGTVCNCTAYSGRLNNIAGPLPPPWCFFNKIFSKQTQWTLQSSSLRYKYQNQVEKIPKFTPTTVAFSSM